jgi:predicted nucleic acid-binding protein
MKAMIDTNVILDVYLEREPFYPSSLKTLELAEQKKFFGFVSATSVTDIAYFVDKKFHDNAVLRQTLLDLSEVLSIADVQQRDIVKALAMQMSDFEDAVQAACSQRTRVNYIVTRNTDDFNDSPVPALSPDEFLKLFATD